MKEYDATVHLISDLPSEQDVKPTYVTKFSKNKYEDYDKTQQWAILMSNSTFFLKMFQVRQKCVE